MCYVRKYQYRIEPAESYKIIRNCSGCGKKSLYQNTNSFRVNANGNRVDIWLIYQCEQCKHTFNLEIYERIKPDDMNRTEYELFLINDRRLSDNFGIDKGLFARNRAIIDEKGLKYQIVTGTEKSVKIVDTNFVKGDLLEVDNPYGIKIRNEKVIAELMNISRSRAQKLQESGMVEVEQDISNKIYKIWIR